MFTKRGTDGNTYLYTANMPWKPVAVFIVVVVITVLVLAMIFSL